MKAKASIFVLVMLIGIAGCTAPEHRADQSLLFARTRSQPSSTPWFLKEIPVATNQQSKKGGASCTANGAPDCGGTCSITCSVGQAAQCIPGRCLPNGSPVCTCESHTFCGCK